MHDFANTNQFGLGFSSTDEEDTSTPRVTAISVDDRSRSTLPLRHPASIVDFVRTLEFLSGKEGVPVHRSCGTSMMFDSVIIGSFPFDVLYLAAAALRLLRVDRECDVVIAAGEGALMEKVSRKFRRSDFIKGREAPTIPRHDCAWLQVLAPRSLSIEKSQRRYFNGFRKINMSCLPWGGW